MKADQTKALKEENERLRRENASLRRKVESQGRLIELLQAEKFGARRERFKDITLDPPTEAKVPDLPFIDDAPDEEGDSRPKKKRKSRGAKSLSKDLPRERVDIEPSPEELLCPHCGDERVSIGEEITELLHYRPASFCIREIHRQKLVCKKHEEAGVVTPALPDLPIKKGMATEGVLAKVITAKYRDHLPLYRQSGIYRREGVNISDSTMGDWIKQSAFLLRPIVEEVKREALSSGYVSTDDTRILVLDKSTDRGSRKGYLWVYLGEQPGDCVFDYTPGRGKEGPKDFLDGFRGYLQADAYAAYDNLFISGEVLEVGCLAHSRRKFYEARNQDPERALPVLKAIRDMYLLERVAKEDKLSIEDVKRLRQRDALPLLKALREWLSYEKDQVTPDSPIANAIGYFLNHYEAFARYTENGRLRIDNNRAERSMRQVAVGRKNWTFAGSDAGAERAATLYSLAGGCWELGLDPFEYFRDVISRLSSTPSSEIWQLTPRGWHESRKG